MVDSFVWAGTPVRLHSQCRAIMAGGEAGVSAQSWKAVCRSWSADNFCRQALPAGRGDWLSILCSRLCGGVDSRVAGTSWAFNHLRSQSTPRSIIMQLLSTASQQNVAGWFLQSNLSLCSLGKGDQEQLFAGVDGSDRYIHSIHDVSSLSLLGLVALENCDPVTTSVHEHQTSKLVARTLTKAIKDGIRGSVFCTLPQVLFFLLYTTP